MNVSPVVRNLLLAVIAIVVIVLAILFFPRQIFEAEPSSTIASERQGPEQTATAHVSAEPPIAPIPDAPQKLEFEDAVLGGLKDPAFCDTIIDGWLATNCRKYAAVKEGAITGEVTACDKANLRGLELQDCRDEAILTYVAREWIAKGDIDSIAAHCDSIVDDRIRDKCEKPYDWAGYGSYWAADRILEMVS